MPGVVEFQMSNKVIVLLAVVCPPGSYFQEDECIPCPLGYYQYQTGRSVCIKCPVGKTTNSYGAISADHCKLNSFFPYPFFSGFKYLIYYYYYSSLSFLKKLNPPSAGFWMDVIPSAYIQKYFTKYKLSGVLTKNAWETSGQSHPGCCGSSRRVHCPQEWYLRVQCR